MNLYAYCENNPIMGYDPNGCLLLALLLCAVGIVGASVLFGAMVYEIYEKHDSAKEKNDDKWIQITNNNVEIKYSWLLQNPIANLTFLLMMRNSDRYMKNFDDDDKNVRGWFDMWLEWNLHNVAASVAFVMKTLTHRYDNLGVNKVEDFFDSIFKRAKDVDMENSKDWFKKMWEL